MDCREYSDLANASDFFNGLSHDKKSLLTQQSQQLNYKTAAQSNMFNSEIFMQHRNEMTII